jgi:hypothetical protein
MYLVVFVSLGAAVPEPHFLCRTVPDFVLKLADCVCGVLPYAPHRLDPVDRAERPQSDRFSRHQQFWKLGRDGGSLNATSRFRVLGNIGNQMRVFLSEAHAQCALDQQRGWIRR